MVCAFKNIILRKHLYVSLNCQRAFNSLFESGLHILENSYFPKLSLSRPKVPSILSQDISHRQEGQPGRSWCGKGDPPTGQMVQVAWEQGHFLCGWYREGQQKVHSVSSQQSVCLDGMEGVDGSNKVPEVCQLKDRAEKGNAHNVSGSRLGNVQTWLVLSSQQTKMVDMISSFYIWENWSSVKFI